jgi:TPR repeat protein
MQKIVYLTSFFFILVVLLSAIAALAQETGVRADYYRYAKLFKAGREPDFATNAEWRGMYARNKWKENADGTELKEPLPEAQVLTGIYLLSTVDKKLNYEIEQIVLTKGLLNKTLAETYVLDQMVTELGEDLNLIPDGELVGDFRGIRAGFKMEKLIRQRITGAVPEKLRTENKALLNEFRPEIAGGWESRYRAIREQISMLDALADSFVFNWSKEKKEAELQRLINEDEGVRRKAETRAKLEIEAQPKNLTAEEMQEITGRHLQEVAKEDLDVREAKQKAGKFIIGVYQGMNYHVRDLEQIYHYYLDAANRGNPIAQYHIALFLEHFRDIVNLEKEDAVQKCQDWLYEASLSDLANNRVAELNAQLLEANNKTEKRKEATAQRIEKLFRLENEKMDMFYNVVIQQAKRVERINAVQKRMLEEMERERERRAITEREYYKAAAMAEAARLESIRLQLLFGKPRVIRSW